MADLARVIGLHEVLQRNGVSSSGSDFEMVYQALVAEPSKKPVAEEVQQAIRSYFAEIQIPTGTTLYDELLLSLRPTDVIATFNWDPLLAQAYKRNRELVLLPRILFLHGNVELGACIEHQQKGFLEHSCPTCHQALAPQKLLYPIAEEEYELDPLIANEWIEFRDTIEEAYLITIVGYAAPQSDVAARTAMLETWRSNPSRDFGEIMIVDIKSRSEVQTSWGEFFVRDHYGISEHLRRTWLFNHPRRSCDHFAMATLQQRPCTNQPLPEFSELADLQEYARKLMEEERALQSGTPFPC